MPHQRIALERERLCHLGLFSSAKDAGPYEQAWVESVCHAVETNAVRYMCGVFLRGQEETATLFKRLRACKDGVFFQPFWTEQSHDTYSDAQMAAVATRIGVVPKNVRYIAVYPAYLVVLGPSKEVIRPPSGHHLALVSSFAGAA